jgi:hypothetical protein
LSKYGLIDEAIEADRRCLEIFGETRDWFDEGRALNNLGITLCGASYLTEAVDAHKRAVAIFRAASEEYEEARCLKDLGSVYDN